MCIFTVNQVDFDFVRTWLELSIFLSASILNPLWIAQDDEENAITLHHEPMHCYAKSKLVDKNGGRIEYLRPVSLASLFSWIKLFPRIESESFASVKHAINWPVLFFVIYSCFPFCLVFGFHYVTNFASIRMKYSCDIDIELQNIIDRRLFQLARLPIYLKHFGGTSSWICDARGKHSCFANYSLINNLVQILKYQSGICILIGPISPTFYNMRIIFLILHSIVYHIFSSIFR